MPTTANRPPRTLDDFGDQKSLGARTASRIGIDGYVREYRAGWSASGRAGDSRKYDSGEYTYAWEDGYLDRAAGRERWHITYCPNHDSGPTGCGEA